MSGALLQLAALGSQDIYLTGNPEITLFKSSFKKHTHFSIETIKKDIDLNFDNPSETISIDKTGTLVSNIVLVLRLNDEPDPAIEWGYVNKIGHAIINNLRATLDGTTISEFNSQWLEIYHLLFGNLSHEANYYKMIGNTSEMKSFKNTHGSYDLFIPLELYKDVFGVLLIVMHGIPS